MTIRQSHALFILLVFGFFFLENRIMKFHVRLFVILKEISMLLTLPELDPRLWLPISVNVLGQLEVIRDILVNVYCINSLS